MQSVLGHGQLFVIYFRYGALMIADVVSHFVIPPADSISSQFLRGPHMKMVRAVDYFLRPVSIDTESGESSIAITIPVESGRAR
ncbi:MAG: hypothetical protein KF909_10195 [Rhodocyclaceae bacterium]|nr:hypothetical protein [Rhodocyclaceae bacterium]